MPSQSSTTGKGQENSSGVERYGKGYIIDGEVIKGIMVRWKVYKPRIDAFEREAGFTITKKGRRMPLKIFERNHKRDADEAELPVEPDQDKVESETESGSHDEEPAKEEVEEKKKAPPKQKKKPAKRQRVKSAA